MADRIVAVGVKAETAQYVAGMHKAAQAAEKTAQSTEKIGSKVDKTNQKLNVMKNIALYAFGYGVAQGVVMAGKAVLNMMMDFEDAMATLGAASMATTGEMDAMREAALQAGQDTQFTATQAADAMTELSKAGVSTSDILGGALAGALDLAAAGQVDVAFAAETAATAMVQFNISGSEMSHVADLLAAGAGKAQGGVEELALALRQGGQVASMVGWDFEDTATALTSFAAAGLLGSDAGTSLKTMLLRLARPSNQAADVMEQYGLSVYDASGNMVGASELAGRLTKAFSGLEPEARNAAMGIIFGTDAVRAANVLYANGESGIEEWGRRVNDAGYAAEQAARKTDTLRGDLNRLRGTVESIMNEGGSDYLSLLRQLVQWTDLLVKATDGLSVAFLDNPMLDGFGGPMGWIMKQLDDAPTKIENVGLAWEQAMTPEGFKLWGSGTGERVESGFSLREQREEAHDLIMTLIHAKAEGDEFIMTTGKVADVSLEAADGLDETGASLDDLAEEAEAAQDEIDMLKESIEGLGQVNIDTSRAHDQLRSAVHDARKPFRDLADAQGELAEANADLAAATTDSERESAAAKVARAEEALAAAKAAITLKGNTEAAIQNRESLRQIAEQAKEAAAAFIDGTAKGADKARREMAYGREEFIKTATQMGLNEQAARDLATEYGLLPKKKQTDAIFMSAEAAARIDAYKQILDGVPRSIITRISTIEDPVQRTSAARLTGMASQYGTWKDGKWVPNKMAKGGWVRGPGTGTSDSIPALLSNGEYVLSARMARVFGPMLESVRTGTSVNNSRTMNANTVNLMTPDPSREWDFMSDLASVS